jgi:hypothetical protein
VIFINKNIIKIEKMKKKYKNTVIMIIIWVFVGFLIVRGIGTVIRGNAINLRPFKNTMLNEIGVVSAKPRKF